MGVRLDIAVNDDEQVIVGVRHVPGLTCLKGIVQHRDPVDPPPRDFNLFPTTARRVEGTKGESGDGGWNGWDLQPVPISTRAN